MNYKEWEEAVPEAIKGDLLWKMKVYRLALFAGEIGWQHITTLVKDKRTNDLAGQLYRALGSIGANIAEGYSRGSGRDRVRFYEYALGSARESRHWYYAGRHLLSEAVLSHRLDMLTDIIRLLVPILPDERTRTIKETSEDYEPDLQRDYPE